MWPLNPPLLEIMRPRMLWTRIQQLVHGQISKFYHTCVHLLSQVHDIICKCRDNTLSIQQNQCNTNCQKSELVSKCLGYIASYMTTDLKCALYSSRLRIIKKKLPITKLWKVLIARKIQKNNMTIIMDS